MQTYTKCTYFFKELMKSPVLDRILLWSHMTRTQLRLAHTMVHDLHKFRDSNTFRPGWIQDPKRCH